MDDNVIVSLNQSEDLIPDPMKAKARHEFEIEFAEALYAPGNSSRLPTHFLVWPIFEA